MTHRTKDDFDDSFPTLDDRQISRLFREEGPGLLRFFRGQTRDREIARDMVQETFLRLARNRSAKPIRNPAAWLQRVACNLMIDRARRSEVKLAPLHVPLDEESAGSAAPEQALRLEAEDLRRRYAQALNALGVKTREVFVLHRIEGLSYREIAGTLGISISTVEYHIMRALAHLDRALGEA